MMITPADLERAERLLEETQPLHSEQRGVALDFHQAIDPDQPALRIAYRTYQPTETVPKAAVLFVHDAWQSGLLYDETALALAERGLFAAALSLGWHGSGRWYSLDPWSLQEMTLERYLQHLHLVVQALGAEQLILVGGGVLGSLLVQQFASDQSVREQVAGMALLGGCVPPLAAATWKGAYRAESSETPKVAAALKAVPPPSEEDLRERWLGHPGVSDADVFALLPSLCTASPRVFQGYAALAGQPGPHLDVPTLVLAGEQDQVVRREATELTAIAYQIAPIFLAGAPHLLVQSPQRQLVFEHLAAFCQTTVSSVPSARTAVASSEGESPRC